MVEVATQIIANTAAIAANTAAITTGNTAIGALTLTNVAALKAATSAGMNLAQVAGYSSAGDGGGGVFRWDSSDTTSTDNGGTILTSTGGLSGRWKRVYGGEVNARWFGVNPSQSDNTAALQKAVDWVASIGGTLFIPRGTYPCAFPSASTITVGASNVLIRGEGKSTQLSVTGHARPNQINYFFTFTQSGRGEGGGVKDLNFYGNAQLKWCIYLRTWRNAEFRNISAFAVHSGILDAEAAHATLYGEGIVVEHLDHAGVGGNTLSQYGVRFRSSSSGPNTTWTDCAIRDCDFIYVWDSGVVLDGVQRFTVDNITASNNGTSTDTVDGSSKSGCRNAVRVDNTIDKSLATGFHVINSIYLESLAGGETAANNNAVYVHEPTGINAQIQHNQISNVVVADNGVDTIGLLKLADNSGFGRLHHTVFRGNRSVIDGNVTVGAGVADTDLYLTPDDGGAWNTLISDAGTRTLVNGRTPAAPVAAVLRPPPAVYDSFTAANSAAPDAGKWTTTVGAGAGAAVDIQGNALQLKGGATGGGSGSDVVALTSTLASTLADAEIEFCLISSSITVESYLTVALRSANALPFSGASAYYLFLAQEAGGSHTLRTIVSKRVSSTGTDLYTGPFVPQASGQKTWFRFRVKGTALTLWSWADGDPVPTVPTWSGTDSGVTGGGLVTFALYGGTAAANGIQKLDNVAIYAL